MRTTRIKTSFVRDQTGFTLVEMMVTIMIMIVVFFALYSIFDMSIRVFSFGNAKVEAVENARLGLEKMEREIRAAYPVDRSAADEDRYLFFSADGSSGPPGDPPPEAMPTFSQITFGNDLETGNGKIECGSPCEYITYRLVGTTLRRINAADSTNAGAPVVDFVEPNGLTFTYLDENGDPCGSTNLDCDGTDEAQIRGVRITLDVRVENGSQDGTQTLTTDVDLRNRE